MSSTNAISDAIKPLFSNRKKKHFGEDSRGSRFRDLADRTWTEWEMVTEAAKKLKMPLDAYVHRALLLTAKRDIVTNKVREKLKPGERLSGVAGAADKRLAAAYEALKAAGRTITPNTLKKAAGTNRQTVLDWIERNATKLEIPVSSEPAVQYGPRSQRV